MEDFQISNPETALQVQSDHTVNLAVRILKVENVQSYTKKDSTTKSFFPCQIADSTGSAWIRVYQVYKQTTFAPGSHLLLRNVIKKTGEHTFW